MGELRDIETILKDRYGLNTRLQGNSLHVDDGAYLSVDVDHSSHMKFVVKGKDYNGNSVEKEFDDKRDVVDWFGR